MTKVNNFTKIWKLAEKKFLFAMQVLISIGISGISIYISDFARNIIDTEIHDFQITTILFRFICIAVIGISLNYLVVIVQSNFSISFISKLRSLLVNKLLNSEYGYYENEHSGSINNKITYDMNTVSDYISFGFPDFIRSIITFFCCFIYLLYLNLSMTLVIVICIPLAVFLASKISAPTYDIMEKFEHRMGDAANIATDSIKGAKIEKAYNIQKIRTHIFNLTMDEATSYYVKYEKLVAKAGPYKYLLKSAPIFICIILGFYNSYQGTITNGEMIAFILLLRNVSNPLSELIDRVTEYKSAKVSMDKLMEMIELNEENFGNENINLSDLPDDRKEVFVFKDVSFQYSQESDEVISNVCLSIPLGKTIAFAGASGCGKSTLFKLMLGFYVPAKGEIRFLGKALNHLNIETVRAQISYVSQSTYLFNGTVAENIGLGKENAAFEEIIAAAKKAYAHDFIMGLPHGYQTVLSESGDNLSGGQRQRLSIARAFLKDAPIFILDEMTSSLDMESEKLIQQAIENYRKDKTVILIAHRLSTIQNADEIYVFGSGNIAEHGTHEHLLNQNGIYSSLYKKQSIS